LRTYIGVDLKAFENKFQSNFKAKYKSIISPLLKAHYAEFSDKGFRLTRKGMMLCDEILPAFSTN
jgi:coproporphyrinogen III oxidase-like Fe-S oxidoreductase